MAAEPKSILIVGRGASAYSFDWDSVDCPVMAVSSGIFAIPRNVHVDHFCTLDEPRNYMTQLMLHCDNAWGNDPNARYWPFWANASIQKHVLEGRIRTIVNNPMPMKFITAALREMCNQTGEDARPFIDAVQASAIEQSAEFGLQPGWGDYQNVRGWNFKLGRIPTWKKSDPLILWRSESNEPFANSIFMAIQLAARFGFKVHKFIGVDLLGDEYKSASVVMNRWYPHAKRAGIRWINLSENSTLPGERLAVVA